MPTLLDQVQVEITWADIRNRIDPIPEIQQTDRSPGWHLMGVLRQVAIDCEMLKLKQVDEEDVEVMPKRMVDGMAFESFYAGFYPEMIWQPGELKKDEVWMSPDGFVYEDREFRNPKWMRGHSPLWIREFKRTHKSYRSHVEGNGFVDERKNWLYLNQGMGYLNGLREMGETDARIVEYHVDYVNGRYAWKEEGLVPTYMKYVVGFKDSELERNWEFVTRWKEKTEKE